MNNSEILSEAIRSTQFPKASLLIKSYLKKNLGTPNVYLFPEPEHVLSSGKTRVGIRYFIHKLESVRFNWLSDGSIDASKNLDSIDYWDGSKFDGKPTYHIKFDHAQSLAKTLPYIVDFMNAPRMGQMLYVTDDNLVESVILNMNSNFSSIMEAREKGGDALPTIANVIRAYSQGIQQKEIWAGGAGVDTYGPGLGKVIPAVKNAYPDFFEKQGTAVIFINKANAAKMSVAKIAAAMGISGVAATVTAGSIETIVAGKEIIAMEENLPRLCFEEQLEDLRRAMVLLMNNATQSLYLAGRGGIGKTQTVEEELHKRGLSDGDGYFKITGSASTAGIYRVLYEHRKDILLFDDSDGALADQDSRNLFKAASDTKKVRKIAWMKAGKNYVDPADMDEDDENPDVLPRYFDFTGKIIFISNLKLDKLDPDGALRTRGYVVTIDPTDEEVYKYMAKIVGKINLDVDYALTEDQRQAVIDVLKSRKLKEGTVNLRSLVRGLNTMAGILKGGGTGWEQMVLRYA